MAGYRDCLYLSGHPHIFGYKSIFIAVESFHMAVGYCTYFLSIDALVRYNFRRTRCTGELILCCRPASSVLSIRLVSNIVMFIKRRGFIARIRALNYPCDRIGS